VSKINKISEKYDLIAKFICGMVDLMENIDCRRVNNIENSHNKN